MLLLLLRKLQLAHLNVRDSPRLLAGLDGRNGRRRLHRMAAAVQDIGRSGSVEHER